MKYLVLVLMSCALVFSCQPKEKCFGCVSSLDCSNRTYSEACFYDKMYVMNTEFIIGPLEYTVLANGFIVVNDDTLSGLQFLDGELHVISGIEVNTDIGDEHVILEKEPEYLNPEYRNNNSPSIHGCEKCHYDFSKVAHEKLEVNCKD